MQKIHKTGEPFSNFAILYRTNAQSRIIEEDLRGKNIPYKIFQGHSFYERAEVKDVLAYLRLVSNEKDDEAFKRVINFPTRGIGKTTLDRLIEAAIKNECSLREAVRRADCESFGIKQDPINKIRNYVIAMAQVWYRLNTTNEYDIAREINLRYCMNDFI